MTTSLTTSTFALAETAPSADALGPVWDDLLQLRDEVIRTGTRRAQFGDAVFVADSCVGVNVIEAGSFSSDELALTATYLAPCFAPVWAGELARAVTFGHVAQTIDGKIATSSGDSKWIGGIGNQTHAHRMRALCDAVLIGARTLTTDAPTLNVRHVRGPDPIRVVIGRNVDVRALRDACPSPVFVVGSLAPDNDAVVLLDVQRDCTGRFAMHAVLQALYRRGITSVYVEGGAQTLEHFLDEDMLDMLQIHIAPIIVGDGRAAFPRPSVEKLVDAQRLHAARFVRVDDGVMLVARCADAKAAGAVRSARTAKAVWHEGAGHASHRESRLRRAPAGWCEIEACASGVSPGTEGLVARGAVPPELHETMRCAYMEGAFTYPVKYGYSLVGTVVDGPDAMVGKLAHVFHPHQDRALVRVEDLHLVPDGVTPERATLAPNLETALNAVWDAEVAIGHRVLVVGFGTVGSLVARLLSRITGVQVHVLDVDTQKRRLATQLGFSAVTDVCPGDYDIAIHTSASGAGLQTAIDAVGFEGLVVDASWYGSRDVTLSLGGSFHERRKRIVSSQVGSVSGTMRGGWTHARRMELVMRLLADDAYDAHITREIRFADLPALFSECPFGLAPSLSILVRYQDACTP